MSNEKSECVVNVPGCVGLDENGFELVDALAGKRYCFCEKHALAAEALTTFSGARASMVGDMLRLLLTLIVALAFAACSAPVESTSIDQAAAGPAVDGACIRSDPQHVPTAGSCYRVESQGTPLDTCEGATAANEEQTPRDKGYIVTAFELEPGACFYFYACRGEATFEAAAPSVEVCP